MRTLVCLFITAAVSVTVTAASATTAEASSGTAASDTAYVESLLYATTLSTFVATAKRPPDTWFDWSTDYCSAPLVGSTGLSFDFTNACRRHDFGYRNLKLIEQRYGDDAWNSASRKRVDQTFLADMRSHCAGRAFTLRAQCYTWAQTFYGAVRLGG
jgi:hypothetical protein